MISQRLLLARARCRGRQRGLTTVEYVVIVVLVAAVAIGAWRVFGERVRTSILLANRGLEPLGQMDLGESLGPSGPSPGGPGAGGAAPPTPGGGAKPPPGPGGKPPSPPVPPGPSATGVPGLGAKVDAIAAQSPTLSQQIRSLSSKGYKVRYTTAGETGSFTDVAHNTIVIDSKYQNDPVQSSRELSHEAGHATSPAPSVGFSGLTRAEYIAKATEASLRWEGAATLNNAKVRDELLANKQPDITIAGAESAQYDAIYKQYKAGKLTRAQAEQQIAQLYGAKETNSKTNQNYKTYYEQYYAKEWDKNYAGKPAGFRAP